MIMKQKILFVVMASISLAILGATTVRLNLAQETFAIKETCLDKDNCWCYESESDLFCFNDKGDCNKRQMSDISGTSGCSKR